MTAILSPTIRVASPPRAHVCGSRHPRATHVFDLAHAIADRPTLRYTLQVSLRETSGPTVCLGRSRSGSAVHHSK